MAEPTNPTGVEQAAPTDEQRMARFLEQHDREQQAAVAPPDTPKEAPPEPKAQTADQPESQAPDEVTPDDIPDDPVEAQPTDEAFEIVHDGQQRKLSREETIKYAQQGFDYTQKTQALAEKAKHIDASLQRVAELEQLAPLVAQDLAQVKAIEAQLSQFQKVDWVALATNDPLEYPKWRAQFDQLQTAYNAASYQLQAKATQLNQGRQELTAQRLQQEFPKLLERIPAWRDPAKYETGARELKSYLIKQGADPARVDSMADSLEASIAYKAMQYDKLVQAKTEKVKQLRTAPPMSKPGASQSSSSTGEKTKELQARLSKTGDIRDAAALLLNRWK